MSKTFEISGLGTTWYVEVFTDNDVTALSHDLRVMLETFEQHYSRFLPESVLSRLNQGESITNPSEEFIELLSIATDWYERTDGVFNPFTAHVQVAQGYDASYTFTKVAEIPAVGSPTDLRVGDTITLAHSQLDFGGFGKGYLLDKLAAELKANGFEEFIINGGGDIYATHCQGGPIEVHLEHPTEPNLYIGNIALHNQALGASSAFKRQWPGQTTATSVSHLITQQSPGASFVIAPTALEADIFATLLCLDHKTATREIGTYPYLYLKDSNIVAERGFTNFLYTQH